MKHTPFGPGTKRTACLDNVAEARGKWHEHGVDVSFTEEGCTDGNCWRNADLGGLANLTLVAGVDVPLDVLFQQGPPEVIEEGAARGVEPFVTEVVMSISDKVKSLGKGNV